MKTSASKGRSTCHSTPASVHAICFMPFEVDLFMATTQSLNFICQRWQWLIHSPESMKSSASKGRNRCHTLASVHGICFMPSRLTCSWQVLNLSILCGKGGNEWFTLKNPWRAQPRRAEPYATHQRVLMEYVSYPLRLTYSWQVSISQSLNFVWQRWQ